VPGDVVAEASGAHFGDGEAAGGDDESFGGEGGGIGKDSEAAVFLWAAGFAADFLDFGFENDGHIGFGRFAQEHSDDLFRGAVAEKLAQSFLVVRDAVSPRRGR